MIYCNDYSRKTGDAYSADSTNGTTIASTITIIITEEIIFFCFRLSIQ